MSEQHNTPQGADRAPGEDAHRDPIDGVVGYLIGLVLAAALTGVSFWIAIDGGVFWQPGVAIGLLVLAVAQMGIHLVFFLHLTSGPDNTNNALAVAFGVLVVVLVCVGTLWIMSNLNANMMPPETMTNMQMQR
ncbi:cytochrome o ubiquinol oxidase subunit IV [Sphingomonas sp. ASV193]|uniref:cytochrome o ubiquinol oxidase subunit IV n=1 Tax=Sphingomonas sp. ASV193 TaxID=3144405 RepID=UPI0032E8C3B9